MGRTKSQRGPSPVNTEVETYAQASTCELVRYHDAKSMIGFSTILCVSDELLIYLLNWP